MDRGAWRSIDLQSRTQLKQPSTHTPELDCSLQIQLAFGFLVLLVTVFLGAKPGKAHACASPANLNSWTAMFILALP